MDYEEWIRLLLEPVVAPVPVATRKPSTYPSLRIRRVGGAAANRVQETVTVTLEAYANTENAAVQLLLKVQSWLLEQANSVARTRIIRNVTEDAGPALLPDPDAPGYQRYTMTVSFGVRRRTSTATP